jgi:hypothetical protein
VVLLGVIAVRASVRLGLPSLLLYLGIGILLGESVLGLQFSDAPLTESLGLAALVLILAEGGLTTRWDAVRPSLGVGITLSTVAVAVSIGVVGVALHFLLDLDWRVAFLWGAVLSSTDAAAVFSVLRGVGVSRRLVGALELESGMNDAPVVLAVVLLAGCAGTAPAEAEGGAPASGSPPTGSAPATEDAGQRIDVTVAAGRVGGDTGRVPVSLGETVTLTVTGDAADEVHLHGYDLTAPLAPGRPATLTFVADVPGVFEAELHGAGTVLLTLQVG